MWTYEGFSKFVVVYFLGLVTLGALFLVAQWAGWFS
jgi:hypothetical protein